MSGSGVPLDRYRGVTVTPMSASVDYLRLSAPVGNLAAVLLEFGAREAQRCVEAGAELSPWSWQGYVGAKADKVSFGERHDGAFVQVSGSAAHGAFLRGPLHGMKSSRLDIQVTVCLPEPDREFYDYVYNKIVAWQEVVRQRSAPSVTRINEHNGAGTVYIGKRGGDFFGRIYDKHRESLGEYKDGSWRYEVQAEKRTATKWYAELKQSASPTKDIASMVSQWFGSRGAPVVWKNKGDVVAEPFKRDPTNEERQIEWLRTHVAPTVKRLMLAGYNEEVMLALFDKIEPEGYTENS